MTIRVQLTFNFSGDFVNLDVFNRRSHREGADMRIISKNLENMPRSGIRVIMDLAAERDEVFHLELGEPGFQTPDHIQEAAIRAMRDGFTKYTANAGLLSLRELVLKKIREENDINADLEQVAVTPGSVFAVASAMMTIAEPGDEVLIPEPGWPNYQMQALSMGLTSIRYQLKAENGYQPDIDEIDALIGPRTRALVVNSPSNPCGTVYSRQTIEQLVDLAVRRDIYIISDEVYERIIFESAHLSPAAIDPDGRVIVIYGFSKSYAMTGFRVGYYVAPKTMVAHMNKALEPYVSCACSISQKAAEAALSGPQDCVDKMVAAYAQRKDIVVNALAGEGLEFSRPLGAFYMLVDIHEAGLDSYAFATELLKETGVAVAPGKTFGSRSDNLIRISFCAETDEIVEGIGRFCEFYRKRVGS
jgi:aspartate aminotransferase/aminotransferase